MRSFRPIALAVLLLGLAAPAAHALPAGPMYPAPGGNGFSLVSGTSGGDVGGWTFAYTGFDTAGLSNLYWGPWDNTTPIASLDGTPHVLTLSSISGTVATWSGTTSWTDPNTSTFYPSISILVNVNVGGLGANPWLLSTSVPGLDPGVGTGIGAVVDNSSGADYTANFQFLADVGSGYQAINTINQGSGGLTLSSFSAGFYTPEPSVLMMLGLGLAGLGVRGRRAH